MAAGIIHYLSPASKRDQRSKATPPSLSSRPGMFQDCGACFTVYRDKSQFAGRLNCAGLPLGGRSFSRVLRPLRGLQSPLVRAAMPVGQTGLQSRHPGCVNSYHHSVETARLSAITIAARAKSWPAARKSSAESMAKSALPLQRGKPHDRSPPGASSDPMPAHKPRLFD